MPRSANGTSAPNPQCRRLAKLGCIKNVQSVWAEFPRLPNRSAIFGAFSQLCLIFNMTFL